MTINASPTDSARPFPDVDASTQYPYVHYPPYSRQYLGELPQHLVNVSGGDPVAVLPSLTEATLYALAAATVLTNPSLPGYATGGLIDPLRAELRWRNCRTMGADPVGPVRRGRLIQMASTFTNLTRVGASPLQRYTLVGRCPCCDASAFRLFLPSVYWRCFACDREGALLEFAEHLLQTRGSAQW